MKTGVKIEELLKQAVEDGFITCPKCGNHLEADAPECICGWKNPLLTLGYI